MKHTIRRLRLHHLAEFKAMGQKGIEVSGQGSVVLNHFFSQEHSLALPLIVIIIHRKMEDVSIFIVVPILASVGSKNGMLH